MLVRVALFALALAGCGRIGFDPIVPDNIAISLAPLYPGHTDWNDYVDRATQASCVAGESGGASACIHAGEARVVTVAGVTSCAGLALHDELDALQWRCDDSTVPVRFIGGGLKPDRGLRDLLDPTAFKLERVMLTFDNVQAATTPLETWWGNQVEPLPDDQIELRDAYAIYTAASSRPAYGYNLEADGIAIVTLDDAVLTYDGTAADNCNYDGTFAAVDDGTSSFRCLIASRGVAFLWIEARLSGSSATGVAAERGIMLINNTFSMIHATSATQFTDVTIDLATYACRMYDVTASGGAGFAELEIAYSDENIYQHVRLFNGALNLIDFESMATNNTFVDMQLDAADGYCINGLPGPATLSHVLAAGCTSGGLLIFDTISHDVTIDHSVTLSEQNGIQVTYGAHNILAAQTVAACGTPIRLTDVDTNTFTGALLVAGGFCDVTGGTNPGLDGSCAIEGASDATVQGGITLDNSFVGAIASLRPAGQLDWSSATSFYQTWGPDNADSYSGVGSCASCRLWDWRLRATDTVMLERSGDGVTQNQPFVAGAPCPRAVDGDRAITDQLDPSTFLVNAVEIRGDNLGDDDGLCETGEACIYSPNLGVYQGEGDYTQQRCQFVDGIVSGVTMYAYPIDHAP